VNLVEHMESRLGRLVEGWANTPNSERMPFQIGHFRGGVLGAVDTYATIGLSKFGFGVRGSSRVIYQELMIGFHARCASDVFPGLIHQLAMGVVDGGNAILRGDVIGPYGAIVPKSRLEAFYAAIPVYYDDNFAGIDLESGNRAAIVWMVPIGKTEASFVAKAGWQEFEAQMVAQDPDLLDPLRREMILSR
jgi:hypothetical protein